eukprot:scaffold2271_cov130-Cylindrotheca_fusiformis.AAC.7
MTGPPLRVLFDNDRVCVSDVRLAPGESFSTTFIFPTVRWQVDDGLDKTGPVKDKAVFFEDPAATCELHNNATDSVFRQVWFEFKQSPRRSEEEVKELLARAIYSTDVGTKLLFENEWCRVWDFCLGIGEGDPFSPHHHVLDYVFVYVARGRLLGYSHDGKPGLFDSINEDGDVTWNDIPDGAELDPKYAHGGKNGFADLPMREYLVELK